MSIEREPREPPAHESVRVGSNLTCPLCLELLTSMAQLEVCPECRSIHHTACVAEMRRCGTIGCLGFQDRPPPLPARDATEVKAAMAWALCAVLPVVGPLAIYLLSWSDRHGFARRHAGAAIVLSLAMVLASTLVVPRLGDEAGTQAIGVLMVGYLAALVLGIVRALRGPTAEALEQARRERAAPPAKEPFDPPTPSSQLGPDASTLE